MVRIGILTSSRADFGVYKPLLSALRKDKEISFEIIAFGTHLSKFHGFTLQEILDDGFTVKYKVETTLANDSEEAIATSAALTSLKFAAFWADHCKEFDIVLCLGDRYEMFSAVIAGVPFGIKYAHFYGGDYSKGAIDNVYRDCLSMAAQIHFTSTEKCADRLKKILIDYCSIDVVGLLSLEELKNIELLSIEEFKKIWNIDLNKPSILATFHPETINPINNEVYANIIYEVLIDISKEFQLIITMPNADINGCIYREVYLKLKERLKTKIQLIENFGQRSYFSCMKHTALMIGNTSSGISEAASFNKYFVNIGNRQVGREFGKNIISVSFDKDEIIKAIKETLTHGYYKGTNIYEKKNSIDLIISTLKTITN